MMKHEWPLWRHRAAFALYTVFLFISTLCLTGCASVPFSKNNPPSYAEDSAETVLISRETPHSAITLESYRNKAYPLTYHLVTVDLSDSSISLVSSPLSGPSSAGTDLSVCVTGETTQAFAERTGAFVAVNATPFDTPDGKPLSLSQLRVFSGLVIDDGEQLSAPEERFGALGFTRDKKAFIMVSQTEPLPEDTAFVFGGLWAILKNGEHTRSFADIQDSRMAAGISSDGKTLFLLCVEGERPLSSRGLNYYDCAEILLEAGAVNAVQFDGGGSISLIIQGNNILSFPQIRKVANNLGIYVTIGID